MMTTAVIGIVAVAGVVRIVVVKKDVPEVIEIVAMPLLPTEGAERLGLTIASDDPLGPEGLVDPEGRPARLLRGTLTITWVMP